MDRGVMENPSILGTMKEPHTVADTLLLDPAFPYGEQLLQFIWERGLYRADDLRTTDGKPLEVLSPGRIHGNSGPDLIDARVRIGGRMWSGAVEVHVRAGEWFRHGHQYDPAYNTVVLHVVHTHDMEVRMQDGGVPPTLELAGRLDEERVRSYRALLEGRGAKPCTGRIHEVDPSRIAIWLEQLLLQRLERKVAVVEEVFRATGNDPMETFYRLLLQGLGRPVNSDGFALLAASLPVKVLLKYRDDPFRLEALLLGQGGFLSTDLIEDHPRRLQEEHRLLARLHGLRPLSPAVWKFGRLRPAAFPAVRLAQAAQLLHRADALFAILSERKPVPELRDLLNVEASDYWSTHYTIGRPTAPRPKRTGRAAVDALLINSIVPCLFAMGRLRGDVAMQERALDLLAGLPPEDNTVLVSWAQVGLSAGNAAQGQALLELERHHCALRRCLFCAIGNQLLGRPVKVHRADARPIPHDP